VWLTVLLMTVSVDCARVPIRQEAGNRIPSIEKMVPAWTFEGGG
jgi:hypothetical protein